MVVKHQRATCGPAAPRPRICGEAAQIAALHGFSGTPCAPCSGTTRPALRGTGGSVNVTTISSFCAAALALGIAACSNNQRPPESAMAEASTTEGGSAIESIAEARCARDSRCDNIGPEKRFSSMEDCVARVREDWRDELDARSCPQGIVDEQL